MKPLTKSSLREMAVGIFIPIAIFFNGCLYHDLKTDLVFDVSDWYMYVGFVIFFPVIFSTLYIRILPPFTDYQLATVCVAIIASGFMYAIVFVFIKKILHMIRQLIEGEI